MPNDKLSRMQLINAALSTRLDGGQRRCIDLALCDLATGGPEWTAALLAGLESARMYAPEGQDPAPLAALIQLIEGP